MAEFLNVFNELYNTGSDDDNSTNTTYGPCETNIDHQLFHLWLLLPSSIMIMVMGFTIPRKNKCMSCFGGRPGAIYPMDILGKSNRFSYVAAWGTIAYLAADMVLSQSFAVRLEGKPYVTAVNGILSMVIYGIDYFPLFAGLAFDSVTGYTVSMVYAWMMLSLRVYKETECTLGYQARLILILRDVPHFLCLLYLSISLPVRTVHAFCRKSANVLTSSEKVSVLNMAKELEKCPEAIHVKQLFSLPEPPLPPPTTVSEKIVNIIKGLFNDWVYQNKPNFRYSSRILSVMFIGIILIYKVTLEMMVLVLSLLTFSERGLSVVLEVIGWIPEQGEDSAITSLRDYTYFVYYLIIAIRWCFVTSATLACIGALLSILHMLSSYRTNLFDMYKGDNTHIPHRSTRSNASLMVGSMKYAGYQVGYIGWGLFIHFLILMIVSVACATIVTMIREGFYQWMINLALNIWPVLVVTIFVTFGQLLVAKFFFLQERGDVLAMDNRRVLFSFTFFMFFYNIFIGFISCLLRIIKSIIIGAIFLPRLDNSALPRRFQMFDPGFAAYVGFIHIESAHTHPVLVLFLRMLLLGDEKRKVISNQQKPTVVSINGTDKSNKSTTVNQPRVSARARTRWFLLYTLHSNPTIRSSRKAYIAYMKEMQDRFARTFNLNKTAMGKLVKEMDRTLTPVGVTDMMNAASGQNTGMNGAQVNWNAVMGMQKFMKILQKDPNMKANADADHADVDLEMVKIGNLNSGFEGDTTDVHQSKPEHSEGHAVHINAATGMWKRAAASATSNIIVSERI